MRFPTFGPTCALGVLLAVAAQLAFPPASSGGTYAVTACFGTENAAWSEWEPSPFATAYVACPGGVVDIARPQSGEGLMVRNTVGPGHAPQGTAAALSFDAPAGTSIVGADFDAKMLNNPGWSAGVLDATHGRWLWCGVGCSTSVEQWIHAELRGLATQRIQALVRCGAARCRRDVRHAFIAVRDARVFLDDPSAPRLGGARGALWTADGWLRGGQEVAFDAADNSGIRLGRVELDGRVVHEDARGCDFTRPVPCGDGPTGAGFDTRTWSDGEHRLRLGAQDAGGNWSWVDRTVRVDNTPPAEPAPALDGGADWSPDRTRTLTLPVEPGQAAPLVRARAKACRLGGACEDSAPELRASAGSASASVTALGGPGEYAVRVALEDAAGNVSPYAPPVTLRFDDARPGAPDVAAADGWHSGGALPLGSEGERPTSGIRGYRVRIGGREAVVATSFPLDDLPEGGTPVEVRAVSGAGLESTAVRALLKLDRTRPTIEADGAPAPDTWSRAPVRVTLRARDQPGLSGVRSLAWDVDGAGEATVQGDTAAVEIGEDGRHSLAYRAGDAAGNPSEPHSVAFKVDRTPPETVAFEAPDPADPRLVRVVVADRTSGVAGGRIELRRAGAHWRPVATTLAGGRLVTRLDDATLRAGAYELRAHVSDVAGNEATGAHRTDGAPAALTLPLRRRTALTLHRTGALLRARLTLDGKPLGGRAVTLVQRLRGRMKWKPVCAKRTLVIAVADCRARTDGAGRVEVRLPAGPSRTLRMAFAGDALLLPVSATAATRSPARTRLRAHPLAVRAGGAVRFTGRLLGGHVPRTGKLVELQARVGVSWRTFATVRADRRGWLRYTHHFAAGSAGHTYLVRLRVPREAAYPFERGTSRPVAVRVT